MDLQALLTHNSSSNVDTGEHLRTATPLSSSSVGSIRSSLTAEHREPDSNSLKPPPTNLMKALEIGSEPALNQTEAVVGSISTPALGSAPKVSNVPGKRSNLMLKWLPSSTSALAEPIERETVSREASHFAKSGGHNSDLIMTPPFTPIKRSELLHSTKTYQTPQVRTSEQFHPHGALMTPPSTIKHEKINASRSRTPLTGLSPALRIAGRNPSRGTSPNPCDHFKPSPTGSFMHQMNNLSPIESHRPRSLSTPMDPNADVNHHANFSRFFTPPSGPNDNFASEDGLAESRKRAGTFCSTASSSFYPLGVSPVPSPLLSPHKFGTPPTHMGRSAQPPASLGSFAKNSTNLLPSASSPLSFSKPGSYLNLTSHRLEDPTAFTSSPSRFPLNPLKTTLTSRVTGSPTNDRHQRNHTAPAEGSPLVQSVQPQLQPVGNEDSPARRQEERSGSISAPSPADRLQSKVHNLRFRPRSSTVAEISGLKTQGKNVPGINWKSTELERQIEEEPVGCTPSRAPRNPAGMSVSDTNDYPWYNALANSHSNAFPGPFNLFSSPMNPPSNWGGSISSISTRYCKVLGVPPKLLGSMKGIVRVRNAFEAFGDLLDIHVDTLSPVGFILVGFHDVRSTRNTVQSGIKGLEKTFASYLKLEPLSRNGVIQLTQDLDNPVLSANEGALVLRFDDPRGIITEEVLIEYLSRYGDLKVLRPLGFSCWFAEWYDDRRAAAAQKEIAARDFADFQVTVEIPEPDFQMAETQYSGAISQPLASGAPNVCLLPLTIRPPSVLKPVDQFNNSMLYRHVGDSYAGNYAFPWNQPLPVPPSASLYNLPGSVPLPADSIGCGNLQPISSDIFGPSIHLDQQGQPQHTNRPRTFPFPGVPPSNVMDLDRIECGSDPRTTCMIKNIPNKITDDMLFNFINETCPRGFDFLYLRMDFKARLNVGYAFINFLSVENVLRFAKSKLGVKWGVFLSEKTVQMCYASIQGKENLIEKFRNSAIMEEEESFRPKIYHSSGPLMGLPEPFPHANDLQRKARSQANAALLVRPPMSPINSIHQ